MSQKLPPEFMPDFAKMGGLLPVIAQCAETNEVLMMAYMNEDSFLKTIETGEACYWSRSRKSFWHKGETSGNVQKIVRMRLDCDKDTLLLLVKQIGDAACHTGRRSCFFYELQNGTVNECSPMIFDPSEVYKK